MPHHVPWYRSNRTLASVLPFLIIAAALARLRFDGTAQTVALVVSSLLLLGFAVLVTANVARRRR